MNSPARQPNPHLALACETFEREISSHLPVALTGEPEDGDRVDRELITVASFAAHQGPALLMSAP